LKATHPTPFLVIAVVTPLTWCFPILVTAALIHDAEKHCNIEIAAQISRLPSSNNGTCVLPANEYFLLK